MAMWTEDIIIVIEKFFSDSGVNIRLLFDENSVRLLGLVPSDSRVFIDAIRFNHVVKFDKIYNAECTQTDIEMHEESFSPSGFSVTTKLTIRFNDGIDVDFVITALDSIILMYRMIHCIHNRFGIPPEYKVNRYDFITALMYSEISWLKNMCESCRDPECRKDLLDYLLGLPDGEKYLEIRMICMNAMNRNGETKMQESLRL